MKNRISIPSGFKRILFYDSLRPGLPGTLMIEPANACNFRCLSCSKQNFKDNRTTQFMKINDFEKIIGQFPGLNNIIFCGIGEPLLNRDIIKMIEIARQRKIKTIRLVTNGSCLTREASEKLTRLLTHVQFSVNGFSPESYARFNGVDADFFEKVTESIKSVISLRNTLTGGLKVSVSAVLTRSNISDLDTALKFCRELKVDSFIAQQLNCFDNRLLHLRPAKDVQEKALRRLKRNAAGCGVALEFLSSNSMPRCYLLWKAAYISADGSVVPCNGYFDLSKWNLLEKDFKKIWHSEDFVNMRKQVIEGKFPYCKTCSNGPAADNIDLRRFYGRYIKPILRKAICRL